MGKDVAIACYCTCCFKCQVTKAPEQSPAPLQPVIATKPWELVAVDALKVPCQLREISLYWTFKIIFPSGRLPEQYLIKRQRELFRF